MGSRPLRMVIVIRVLFLVGHRLLNWMIGVPVVLIDKEGAPATNFEFQIRYFDVFNTESGGRNFTDKVSVGLTVGVPFSKIIY